MSKGSVIAMINKKRFATSRKVSNLEIYTFWLFSSTIGNHTQLNAQTIEMIKSFAPGKLLNPMRLLPIFRIGELYERARILVEVNSIKLFNDKRAIKKGVINRAHADVKISNL